MYIIYALFFKNQNRIYVGMTSNLEERVKYHKRGKTRSTKNKGEFIVEIIEECESRESAREKEIYWKSGCGKEKLKIIRNNVKEWNIAGWSNGSSCGS